MCCQPLRRISFSHEALQTGFVTEPGSFTCPLQPVTAVIDLSTQPCDAACDGTATEGVTEEDRDAKRTIAPAAY